MNVLLLYPEFPDTFWSFKHALKFIRKKAALPPLGLLTVAAMLPEDWAKHLVDVNVRKLRAKDLAWANVVFISGMIAQRDSAHELIARCHAAGKTIVAGGPLFTLGHEQFPEVDHFVLNETEVTLPEFVRDFERGAARRVYASLKFPLPCPPNRGRFTWTKPRLSRLTTHQPWRGALVPSSPCSTRSRTPITLELGCRG